MSTTGIYGLSGSGIDVDSMVKVGMLTKQNQYDKMYKEEVKNEWMKEAYSDLYSDLNTFNQTTLSTYKMSSTTSPMTATSTSEGVATATANADAANMSHTVTVSSVASNAYMQSTKAITRKNSSASSTSIYLKDLLSSTEQEPSNYSTMSDSQKLETALSFTISDGASDNSNATTKEISFTYKDLFESNQTLNDLATKIKNSGVNIQASYDSVNDSFSLYQKTGGKANQINITVGSGSTDSEKRARTLLSSLNLGIVTTADDGTQTLGSAIDYETTTSSSAEGKDGKATIDGKTYTTTGSKITVANVAYTLAGKGTTTVSVAQDTDKVVENVKQFVTDYNKMIDSLNDKYYEKQYSDYGVLTKSQESAMTQDQITKWNEKAKSGLLYHDSTLGKVISSMREALYTPVDSASGNYNTMMSIGITSSTDQGHITLDETKLKKALAAEPNCVREIFSNSGDTTTTAADGTTTTTTDYKSEGVMNRISDMLYTNLKTMKRYSGDSTETSDGSTLGDLIENLKTKMSDFKTQMDAYQKALYDKYDAMESAIQQLSVQLGYITGGN